MNKKNTKKKSPKILSASVAIPKEEDIISFRNKMRLNSPDSFHSARSASFTSAKSPSPIKGAGKKHI